jgi:DNA adenine methylase
MASSHNKSPLRYPGGKSKGLKKILPLVPKFDEYREPMVGGGSVFFALIQKYPKRKYWINDKNTDVYLFWKFCKEEPKALILEIKRIGRKYQGKELYRHLKENKNGLSNLQRAARFFILNRITFSGNVESGGYSEMAFDKRFTDSSVDRILEASDLLQGVTITNWDYSVVLSKKGKNVFIFLDPPYMSSAKAKLYGENGKYHTNFNHKNFYENVRKCKKHKWLITYDKCAGIKEIYKASKKLGWKKKKWTLQYGMNVGLKEARIGKELFIRNYTLRKSKQKLIN